MNKERFAELTEAIRQARAVRRGEATPSRVWNVTRAKDGKFHRCQLDPKLYQQEQRSERETTMVKTLLKSNLART